MVEFIIVMVIIWLVSLVVDLDPVHFSGKQLRAAARGTYCPSDAEQTYGRMLAGRNMPPLPSGAPDDLLKAPYFESGSYRTLIANRTWYVWLPSKLLHVPEADLLADQVTPKMAPSTR